MERTFSMSRRGFVGLASLATAGAWAGPRASANTNAADEAANDAQAASWHGLKVGVATYSFSRLPLEAAVAAVQRVGARYVSIKDAHLPLKSSAEQRQKVARMFRDAGAVPLSCGVIGMNDDQSALRNAFEYARDAGIPTIVCKPTRRSLSVLDGLVKEFNVRLAIHNHGPGDKVWPSPLDVWEAVQKHDERIGLCIDVGHTARCGVDPAGAIRTCSARLYDVHFKDLSAKGPKGRPEEVGRGALDTRGMLRALIDVGYQHHIGLEYEKNLKDPVPGVAESLGYIHGTLAGMR